MLETAGSDWGSHPVVGGLTIGCGQMGVGGAAAWPVQLFLQGRSWDWGWAVVAGSIWAQGPGSK